MFWYLTACLAIVTKLANFFKFSLFFFFFREVAKIYCDLFFVGEKSYHFLPGVVRAILGYKTVSLSNI